MQTQSKPTTDGIPWPTDEIRDVMLQLRGEQAQHHARLEVVLRQLAKITGDLPRPKAPLPFVSRFLKSQNSNKTNRK